MELVPIYVDLIAPAHGNVRSLFPVTYDIYNRTPYSQEVEVTMEASDAFMFSGNKQVPGSFHTKLLDWANHTVCQSEVLQPWFFRIVNILRS